MNSRLAALVIVVIALLSPSATSRSLLAALPAADPATPDVAIATIPGTLDALLTWLDDGNTCRYEVHRDTIPYFTPGTATLSAELPAGSTSWRSGMALGWVGTDYYYVVRALPCGNTLQADSEPIAAFDFGLAYPVYRLSGLNFSPYKSGQDPSAGAVVSEAQVRERMSIIAPYTSRIRTYGCGSGLEVAGRVAHELELEAAIGAWLDTDLTANNAQMACLIARAQAGEVDLAVIGSETLHRKDAYGAGLTEAQLLDYIQQFRTAVPGVPVTTGDTFDQWLQHPNVVSAVDRVLPNYYPYWSGIALENAVGALAGWHAEVVSAAGGKPVVVSETGWPSCGNAVGEGIASPANAQVYFEQFVSWARAEGVAYYYFEAFDEAWKAQYEGPQGACWGIWDQWGTLKPGMGAVFDGKTVPVTYLPLLMR